MPKTLKTQTPSQRKPTGAGMIRWFGVAFTPETLGLGVVLLVAALFRFLAPDWYWDRQFHPDERWITGVVGVLSYPAEPAGLQYGTFPLYLLAVIKDAVAFVAGWFGPFDVNRFVIWAGRMLSGLIDLATLVFTYLLGTRWLAGTAGRRVGLWAAAFLAVTVLNIQMAHFFVVDVPLACLSLAVIYWSTLIAQQGRRQDYVWVGICMGLALATKTSALPLAAAVGVGHLIGLTQAKRQEHADRWQDLLLAMGVALLTFFVAMPHAFLDWSKFWANQNEQRRILVTGEADVPYNRQYLHTLPFLYYIQNLLRYTMGWPLGVLTLLAFVAYPVLGSLRLGKDLGQRAWTSLQAFLRQESGMIIALTFGWIYWAVIGVSFAKFNRYLLPLTPILCLVGSRCLEDLKAWSQALWLRRLVSTLAAGILLATFLWALAFSAIYAKPHPWITASRWLLQQVPATVGPGANARPTAILNEEWGDDLPVHVKDLSAKPYRFNKFSVQEPDTPEKRRRILELLQANDVIVMADTRAHAVYRRLADRYPINAAYYQLMFEQQLGFKLAAEFTNYPTLFGQTFPDDDADESFTLYDHPHVYLFQRGSEPLSSEELARRLDEGIARAQTKVPVSAPPVPRSAAPAISGQAVTLTAQVAAQVPAAIPVAGDLSPAGLKTVVNQNIDAPQGKPRFILGALNSVTAGLAWVILLEIVGLLAIPLCVVLFPRLPDSGVALAKILGTLVLAWTTWFLVSLGVIRHLQGTTFLVLLLLGGAALFWANRNRLALTELVRKQGWLWLTAEIIFLVAFVGYMLTKLYNPDIHNPFGQGYNGGGEPMGMTFFSAAYQSVHFPPYDPWLSGYPINYYYYGQVMLGILAKLIGVPPAWSYNIAISLLFALTVTGVYGLGLALTGRRAWGVAAAVGAGMLGNLHAFFYLLEPLNRWLATPDVLNNTARWVGETLHHAGRFEFIWNPTRLIKGTINEMPWFSFIYGDLHAHIIAMPYSLPLIAWGLNRLLTPVAKPWPWLETTAGSWPAKAVQFGVIAISLGALSAINTWNFPPYALLILCVLLLKVSAPAGRFKLPPIRAVGAALLAWLRLVVAGLLLLFFFHLSFVPQSTSLAFVNPAVRTHMKEFLVFFSLPILALISYGAWVWVPVVQRWAASRGWRGRKPWGERLLAVTRNAWDQEPNLVYAVVSAALGVLVFALFEQTLLALLVLLLLGVVYTLVKKALTPQLQMLLLLAAVGLAIVLGCELVHIRDFMGVGGDMSRMNTVFKFYMIVWIFFSLVAAGLFAQLVSLAPDLKREWKAFNWDAQAGRVGLTALGVLGIWGAANFWQENTGTPWLAWALVVSMMVWPWVWRARPQWPLGRLIWAGVLGAVLIGVALYPPIAIFDRMNLCSRFQYPTLNGAAYLDRMRPQEAKALRWINAHLGRTEIILEAPGRQGYNCFDTRVAIFTGHPTLIGWIGEEEQMRYNNTLTNSRTLDADRIFSLLDPLPARDLMERYRVRYVFVGENERQQYPAAGLEKFRQFMDPVYEQDGIIIYRTRTGGRS